MTKKPNDVFFKKKYQIWYNIIKQYQNFNNITCGEWYFFELSK